MQRPAAYLIAILSVSLTLLCRPQLLTAAEARPNVLMIAVDDLNHWVGHLGRNRQTRTPNLDRLAKLGTTFTNAHCAAPICNPSRAALLSGLRPSSSGIYDNSHPFRTVLRSEQSLVTQFRRTGYKTMGMGKLWHGGLGFPNQWSETGGNEKADTQNSKVLDDRSIGPIRFGILNADDSAVPDTRIADYGIAELSKHHAEPFFLTLGFHKPHMPWNVPRKYYDLHPLDSIELPPTKDNDLDDIPAAGRKIALAFGDHAKVVESKRWKEAVQAYLAAISYLDAQVGRVLDALEQSAYRNNTIICLWGDHGWHLGEKEHWRKFALWEEATRAPLIWVAPGVTQPGTVCTRPVDFMTIYPTLCDLAGIEIPEHVEGRSIRPLLMNPTLADDRVAVTTYGRNNHAARDDRWRFIRYADGSEELYDHDEDPYEWTNLASRPDLNHVKERLATAFPATNVEPIQTRRQEETSGPATGNQRPNIVWVVVEDMSAHYSCYGESTIQTPHVDQLAAEGTMFRRAFVTAPICSICRSSLITGRYQTSIGVQNHRSSVPGHEIRLPDDVKLIPAVFREAGYHTNNLTVEAFVRTAADVEKDSAVKVAKTDYNFEWDEASTYDATHWRSRPNGKPFFVQVQLHGGKYRGQGNGTQWPARVIKDLGSRTKPEEIQLPPYLPDDPVIREDWAQYLDTVRYTDWEVGKIVAALKDAGELDRTVIFFMTDHGISHVRNKQFLYDGGTHVPLIIRGPAIAAGIVREDVVEHIDLGATSFRLAGIDPPAGMHSQDILAPSYTHRDFVFAARDRADETVDLIRSVRDERWKYIRNGFPNRPYLQPNNYKDNKPIVQAMRRLYAEGKLSPEQSLIMAETRPAEELYDTVADPFELQNLADDVQHSATLMRLRNALTEWQVRTHDPISIEPRDIYLVETGQTHAEGGRGNVDPQYQANVELMLRWMTERPLQWPTARRTP